MCTKQWSILYHSAKVQRVCEETHKYLWRWQKSKHGNVRSRKTGAHVVLPPFLNNITDVNWPGHDQPKRAGTFFRSRWIRFHYHLVNWSYCFCVCHFPKKNLHLLFHLSSCFSLTGFDFSWQGLSSAETHRFELLHGVKVFFRFISFMISKRHLYLTFREFLASG